MFRMADTVISGMAIDRFNKGMNPAVFWVYWGVAWMMFMSWCSAAWVVYQTVQSAISWGLESSHYYNYANWSDIGNLWYLWELIAVSVFLLWSLWTVILSVWAGSEQWRLMDERMDEANTNQFNVHTPLRWDTGIMHFMLSVMTGMTTMISGVALGEAIKKVVAWFD